MMYHCIAIAVVFPSDTKDFEDVSHPSLHQPIHYGQKQSEKEHRRNYHRGRRNNIVLARPGYLLHFHAHVVHEFARVRNRSGNPLADSRGRSGYGVAARFLVLHFYRLRGHKTLFTSGTGCSPFRPSRFRAPAGQALLLRSFRAPISGRGGGTRTPIPGFGDRSPSRWTTPLNRRLLAIHPEAAPFAAEGFAPRQTRVLDSVFSPASNPSIQTLDFAPLSGPETPATKSIQLA